MHSLRFLGFAFFAVFLVLSAGCFPKKSLPPEVVRPLETAQSLLGRADRAWQARDFAQSAGLYDQLAWVPREGVEEQALPLIRERLVISLVRIRSYVQALQALKMWAEQDPRVESTWPWHDSFVHVMIGQGRMTEALDHLSTLLHQSDAPWDLRYAAGVRLVELHRQARMDDDMIAVFSTLYAMAPNEHARAELERMAMQAAKGLSDEQLQSLVRGVRDEGQLAFPGSVFAWEQQRRLAVGDARAWPGVRSSLQHLLEQGQWADTAPLSAEMGELQKQLGPTGICVGLVLPLDGALGETGWKVLRGAEAGRAALFAQGLEVRLEVVNALASNLEAAIRDLDSDCAVIGGPMQREAWDRLHASGLHRERTFFTFLPSLEEGQEGRDAWRFFSAPQDQVRALAELTVRTLGIASSGVLYPEDRFGRFMSDLFAREMEKQGGVVSRTHGYGPGDHGEWGKSVAALLGVQVQQRRGRAESVQLPEPGFRALFIPDGLTQAEMLIPQLFYYDEQRLLILGPELWSQAWARRADRIESQYFRLAVMPGAWWPDNPSTATKSLLRFAEEYGVVADFWMALGYDFVRWAAMLQQRQPVADKNGLLAALTSTTSFAWSMAPINWDPQGTARQELYLFQPGTGRDGLSILDPEALRVRVERIGALPRR